MAVSNIPTYTLLNAWQRVMQADPWMFNQVLGRGVPYKEGVKPYVQPERDDIARALNSAYKKAVEILRYHPRPTYFSERIRFGRGSLATQLLRTRWGNVSAMGARATTLIDADAEVTYTDEANDLTDDTATITVTTSVAVGEIQVFFRTADGAPGAADPRYQIEPLTVSASGNTVTITGHRSLFVSPREVWQKPFRVDGGNFQQRNFAESAHSNEFVTAVDVYRVYTDATQAVQVVTDDLWRDCVGCNPPATSTITSAEARLVDPELGLFQVRPDACLCYPPEQVIVNYCAGLPLEYGDMDAELQMMIIRLANCTMPRQPCTLYDRAETMWSTDRKALPPEELLPGDAANPFGLMRGQVDAWRVFMRRSLATSGGKITGTW